jgi:hypothetical protein
VLCVLCCAFCAVLCTTVCVCAVRAVCTVLCCSVCCMCCAVLCVPYPLCVSVNDTVGSLILRDHINNGKSPAQGLVGINQLAKPVVYMFISAVNLCEQCWFPTL